MTTIGILLFDGAEELDFVGPWEVLTASAMLHEQAGAAADTVLSRAEPRSAASSPTRRARKSGRARPTKPVVSVAGIPVTARVADVHARIAAIQTKFGPAPSAGGGASVQFDSVLSQAVGTTKGTATLERAAAAGPATAVPATGSGQAGERAVAIAKQQLGKPYVWGAESPSTGFDCSGLVQYTFKQLGVDLPRVSRDQARAGRAVGSLAQARPGDLIAFGSPVDHIGIYAGNNKMVVAPHSGDVVKVQEVYRTPTAIRRVI